MMVQAVDSEILLDSYEHLNTNSLLPRLMTDALGALLDDFLPEMALPGSRWRWIQT